jgi:transcriptional regulator with XRE-family HTH domain
MQKVSARPITLGEHIKKVRIARHLLQADIARQLGVHRTTIQNWERGATAPAVKFIPLIIGFLGYDPEPEP